MKRALALALVLLIGLCSFASAETFPFMDEVGILIAINNMYYEGVGDPELKSLLTIYYDPANPNTAYSSAYSYDLYDNHTGLMFDFATDYLNNDGIYQIQVFADASVDQNAIALGNIAGFLALFIPGDALADFYDLASQVAMAVLNAAPGTEQEIELADGLTFKFQKLDEDSCISTLTFGQPINMELLAYLLQ